MMLSGTHGAEMLISAGTFEAVRTIFTAVLQVPTDITLVRPLVEA
jgi:hypothetical protein